MALVAPIYPATVGDSWNYRVKSSYASCPSGDRRARVLGKKTLGGREALEIETFCGGATGYVTVKDDTVDSYYNGTWWRFVDSPVEDGHTWRYFAGSTATWHRLGSVTVAAGTFSDCWRLTQNVSYTATLDLCRGVGPVRWLTIDLAGGRIEAELTSFSVKGEQ